MTKQRLVSCDGPDHGQALPPAAGEPMISSPRPQGAAAVDGERRLRLDGPQAEKSADAPAAALAGSDLSSVQTCLVRAGEWCFRKFLEEIGGGGHSTVAEMSDHIRKAIAAENFLQPCAAVRGLPCPHVPLTPHYSIA